MEENWITTTDPREKKRIQNRVAQRVHREKLKSRIRQLEEQLESVTGTPAFDDPTMPLPALGVLPIANPGLTSANFGTSSGDITFPGNHASSLFLGSNDAVESGLNAIPQTSMLAQLDCISQIQVQNQSTDNEWLLTDLGTPKTVLEHTQIYTPSMERGQRKPDYCQSPSRTRLPQHVGTSNHVQIGGNSGQSAHKMTSTLIAQNTGHETAQNSDATRLERLTLLAEHSRRLGFSSLNEALSVYYTSDVSKSAILSHEQSLSRVRHLPSFLSDIREHSKHWPTWERDNYVRETLRSAEDIYAEECRIARMNLSDQGLIGLTQKEFQFDQMIQITRVLQQEIPNTWALITSIILHTVMPGEPQRPQTILMVMLLLCYRSQDPTTILDLCQEYLYKSNGTDDNRYDSLH